MHKYSDDPMSGDEMDNFRKEPLTPDAAKRMLREQRNDMGCLLHFAVFFAFVFVIVYVSVELAATDRVSLELWCFLGIFSLCFVAFFAAIGYYEQSKLRQTVKGAHLITLRGKVKRLARIENSGPNMRVGPTTNMYSLSMDVDTECAHEKQFLVTAAVKRGLSRGQPIELTYLDSNKQYISLQPIRGVRSPLTGDERMRLEHFHQNEMDNTGLLNKAYNRYVLLPALLWGGISLYFDLWTRYLIVVSLLMLLLYYLEQLLLKGGSVNSLPMQDSKVTFEAAVKTFRLHPNGLGATMQVMDEYGSLQEIELDRNQYDRLKGTKAVSICYRPLETHQIEIGREQVLNISSTHTDLSMKTGKAFEHALQQLLHWCEESRGEKPIQMNEGAYLFEKDSKGDSPAYLIKQHFVRAVPAAFLQFIEVVGPCRLFAAENGSEAIRFFNKAEWLAAQEQVDRNAEQESRTSRGEFLPVGCHERWGHWLGFDLSKKDDFNFAFFPADTSVHTYRDVVTVLEEWYRFDEWLIYVVGNEG
ncbi:hypothetical protein [Olivibacter sitiensis]|uniref:hypothetical protein n=1 Tax=Olivibacter sitiensis TaxID=376470 RepID=UPI00041E13B8|nr:hypothetical protein [Olivibacter sitiensis]